MKMLISFCIFVFTISNNLTSISYAIFGGDSVIGDKRVVALISDQYNTRSGCSGALIEPQIVVAAAHCLGNLGSTYLSELYEPKDLWISQPGADLNLDNKNSRVKVLRVVLTKGYNNSWEPEKGNYITQKDDIAFYFLEKPLVSSYSVPIANKQDVTSIKNGNLIFTHIGYGLIEEKQQDGKPYSTQLNSYSVGKTRYPGNPALEENTVSAQETGAKALCAGDSGSPWYSNIDGIEKIVAVTVAASGCQGTGSGLGGALGTVIYPYLHLLNTHWKQFLEDLPALQKLEKSKLPDLSLPLIQRSGGCDAKVNAVLQILNSEVWVDLAEAQGWELVSDCPKSNPYQPWVRAKVKSGVQIRWHIFLPGQWDFWTDPVIYNAPTPTVKNLLSIKCSKGKLSKLVTGSKPKCPAGYKKA